MSIVITGNPGVGKHSVAEKLAKVLKYRIVDINRIAVESGLCERKNYEDNDDNSYAEVDVSKLRRILKDKITTKSLIVGHLAPYVVAKKQVRAAVVLRKNPYKLVSVYKKRNYSGKKLTENLGSEILGVTAYDTIKKFGQNKTYQIDATSKSLSKIIKTIRTILEGSSDGEVIDWLTVFSTKKDLRKFFTY